MELRGIKLKEIRQQQGLTQGQLAAGICTQATISLMENKNKLPSMVILYAVCERLGVQASDLITEDARNLGDTFDRINGLIMGKQFEAAATELETVRIKQIRSEYDKQRYYYFIGVIQLNVNHDLNEALFNLQLSVQDFAPSVPNLYQVMANIQLGFTYLDQENFKLAGKMVEAAWKMVTEHLQASPTKQLVEVYVSLARLGNQTNLIGTSIAASEAALQLCKDSELLVLLDEIFLELARAHHAQGDSAAAHQNVVSGLAFNDVLGTTGVRAALESEQFKLGTNQ